MNLRVAACSLVFWMGASACDGGSPGATASSSAPVAGPQAASSSAELAAAGGAKGEVPTERQRAAAREAGKAIYHQYCIACHGSDGKGNHGLGGDYRKVLKDRDRAELVASIKNGKVGTVGRMPPWGALLDDAEVDAVLSFVQDEYGPQ